MPWSGTTRWCSTAENPRLLRDLMYLHTLLSMLTEKELYEVLLKVFSVVKLGEEKAAAWGELLQKFFAAEERFSRGWWKERCGSVVAGWREVEEWSWLES